MTQLYEQIALQSCMIPFSQRVNVSQRVAYQSRQGPEPVLDPCPGLQTQSRGPEAFSRPDETSDLNTVPAGHALTTEHCSTVVAPGGLVYPKPQGLHGWVWPPGDQKPALCRGRQKEQQL